MRTFFTRRNSPSLVRIPSRNDCSIFSSRSEEHTSELQSQSNLVCRLLLEKKKKNSRIETDRPHRLRRASHLRLQAQLGLVPRRALLQNRQRALDRLPRLHAWSAVYLRMLR